MSVCLSVCPSAHLFVFMSHSDATSVVNAVWWVEREGLLIRSEGVGN
jgi:hypothetical protein